MTLILALQGADGIVMAADSRGTFGDPRAVTAQNDSILKVHQLSKYAGVLIAGDGGIATTLLSSWPQDINAAVGVTEVMVNFRNLVRQRIMDWFQYFTIQPTNPTMPVRPTLTFILAGYDPQPNGTGVPAIFALPGFTDFAPAKLDYGFALDGVGQYALYLLNRLYRKDRPIQELENLAAYSITETASQDGKVGGPVRMATITPQEGYRQLTDDVVDGIINSNAHRNEALRRSFYGEAAQNE